MAYQVEFFVKLALARRYVCVYIDATNIAVGIRKDGSKEVLTYTIAPTESAYTWNELDVTEHGMEEVLLFISYGLKGIVTAIETNLSLITKKTPASTTGVNPI